MQVIHHKWGRKSMVLLSNKFYSCWIQHWSQKLIKINSQFLSENNCIRLLQLCWKHYCLPTTMDMLPGCNSCGWCFGHCHACHRFQFQLHCKPHLEDTFSQGRFLNILLLADWYAILVCREQSVNGVLLCPNEQLINLTLWLVKKSSNMTKLLKVNLNQKLLEPLRFFGSTQYHCDDKLAVLPMVLMFDVPCHIRSPHLCNLTWNSCFFLINYVEALLHLSPDSQETPLVDFHMSFLWFFVISWAWAMHAHSCHSLVLSLCVLNALSSLYPPYHNFWKYHYSKLGNIRYMWVTG